MNKIACLSLALLVGSPGPNVLGAQGCIADWSVAARIVQENKLASVEDITSRLDASRDGSVVKAALCVSGDAYVYRLTMKDRTGALKNRTFDARASR